MKKAPLFHFQGVELPNAPSYEYLKTSLSRKQWERIGAHRRSGVVAPLFSLYSSESSGIGEIPDLNLLVDWCNQTKMGIIQLLPMNDVGFSFRPYDAQSTFALEPMHLSLSHLRDVHIDQFKSSIESLKMDFPAGQTRVNYALKKAKCLLLRRIFDSVSPVKDKMFDEFKTSNSFWLEDYALYKTLKEKNNESSWESWSDALKNRMPDALSAIKEDFAADLEFHQWLQWHVFLQFKDAYAYAKQHHVLFMGDLPFLVSRDSADVWSHQDYFKLNLASGAPPDLLYSQGQRWGMPPYNWNAISNNNYNYLIEKLRYAENFYDLYRIDHVVGVFRVWTIPLNEPEETAGLNGSFDPKEEAAWEEHGRKLLRVMVENSKMLACAEDLGTVPDCSFRVLEEFGIPGIDVQRWMRDWGKSYSFKKPDEYRKNSLATIATHDMSGLIAWWLYEAQTVDALLFERRCSENQIAFETLKPALFDLKDSHHGRLRWKKEINTLEIFLEAIARPKESVLPLIDLFLGSINEKEQFVAFLGQEKDIFDRKKSAAFVRAALEKVNQSASIFATQLIHDWLSLDDLFETEPWETRINFPGTISGKNWSLTIPLSLEDLLSLPLNSVIAKINETGNRYQKEARS